MRWHDRVVIGRKQSLNCQGREPELVEFRRRCLLCILRYKLALKADGTKRSGLRLPRATLPKSSSASERACSPGPTAQNDLKHVVPATSQYVFAQCRHFPHISPPFCLRALKIGGYVPLAPPRHAAKKIK